MVLNISKNVAWLENCLPEVLRISCLEVGLGHQDFFEVLRVILNMRQGKRESTGGDASGFLPVGKLWA